MVEGFQRVHGAAIDFYALSSTLPIVVEGSRVGIEQGICLLDMHLVSVLSVLVTCTCTSTTAKGATGDKDD